MGLGLLKLLLKTSVLIGAVYTADLVAEEQSSAPVVTTQNCPEVFYDLPLYPNAKFCQLFAEKTPASMSYFAISDQQTAKKFYIEQLGQAEDEQTLKGRIVLQYNQGQTVLIISKDGDGSQIDILVKTAG